MKYKLREAIAKHFPRSIKTLASAAVVVSLTACGADTLDSIQADLANGEDVNLTLSSDEDGNLVVGISDNDTPVQSDDTGDTDTGAPGALYDESVDGEITDDPTNPLSLALGAVMRIVPSGVSQ